MGRATGQAIHGTRKLGHAPALGYSLKSLCGRNNRTVYYETEKVTCPECLGLLQRKEKAQP